MDEIGLDVCVKVGKIMFEGLGERATPSGLAGKLYELKLLGKKNGKGFYLYDEKGKVTGKNPEVAKILPSKKGVRDEMTIQMRLFLPMVNEAAYILADKICDKAATVDIGMIYGTGFPPFKGGLLKWADAEGLDRIAERLKNFASEVSRERYQIAPFLQLMIGDKKKFYDL
jgi:3-hydroxyacyl-CoA dehydrogenase/enoyl-CoA hydratase/3-hydroxybutyryl-CoA epimerase